MRAIRTTLSVGLMTAALSVFAAPAVASDFVWTYQGNVIEEPKEIELAGEIKWMMFGSFIECDVEGDATLEEEGSGQITQFAATDCTAEKNPSCELKSSTSSVPWSMHVESLKSILIEDLSMSITFKSPCGGPIPLLKTDIHAGFQKPGSITDLTLYGGTQGFWGGELTVSPSEVGIREA